MPLLYYWRGDNYRRDLDMGAGYHLNQANPLLHHIDVGDSLWAFTRTSYGVYVLAAELVIRAKTFNPRNFTYGRYRVWGDLKCSRYFSSNGQPSIEYVIRSLSCRINAEILGMSFQGLAAVRRITIEDHQLLLAAAKDLPLEPRAHILPEDRLEAALLLGNRDLVDKLIVDESPGISQQRREYLYKQAPTRNQRLSRQLQEMYAGQCQLTGWDPRLEYGQDLCHAHHIQWLSRGGEDTLDNLVLLSPNVHAAIHSVDAPFDFNTYTFDFGLHAQSLKRNLHLQ